MDTEHRQDAPIILAHHTVLHAGFEDRVRAAAAAGYDGIGVNFVGYRAWRDEGLTDDDMDRILAEHGQRILEVEALRGWSADGPDRERSERLVDLAFHLADRFGVPYLQAIGPYSGTVDHAAAEFAALCDRAAEHKMVVGLEFFPQISNIPDVSTARRIVETAARPNCGMCIDAWHFTRGNADWEALAELPPELVACVQIDDGSLVPENPDYLEDCLTNRRIPGSGEFELERLIRTLDAVGCNAPISVEVISRELDAMPAVEVAMLTMKATRDLLTTARS